MCHRNKLLRSWGTDWTWICVLFGLSVSMKVFSKKEIITCSASNAPIKNLIWRFNHNELILQRTWTKGIYNAACIPFLEDVSGSRLILKGLTSRDQGVYNCHLSSERETYTGTGTSPGVLIQWMTVLGPDWKLQGRTQLFMKTQDTSEKQDKRCIKTTVWQFYTSRFFRTHGNPGLLYRSLFSVNCD